MIPVTRPFLRPNENIVWFSSVMELKIFLHNKKSGWIDEEKFPQDEVINRIKDEVMELEQEIENMENYRTTDLTINQLENLIKEYADVANFCMMGANQARLTLKKKREKDVLL